MHTQIRTAKQICERDANRNSNINILRKLCSIERRNAKILYREREKTIKKMYRAMVREESQ